MQQNTGSFDGLLGYRSLYLSCGFAWSVGHRSLVAFARTRLLSESERNREAVFVHSGIKDETKSWEVAAIPQADITFQRVN